MSHKFSLLPWMVVLACGVLHGQGVSSLVYPDANGQLVYEGYANQGQTSTGNLMIDFSHAGYEGGGVAIPWVPAEAVLDPLPGTDDDYARIQSAIDAVSALPLSPAGFRGAVHLRAGTYHVSQSLRIESDGVVIRGAGQDEGGTILRFTATTQDDLFEFFGSGGWTRISGTTSPIADTLVPSGTRTFNAASAGGFSVGDRLMVQRTPNQAWIDLLDMDQYGWTPGAYNSEMPRVITAIDGDTITVDAPVVHAIESQYGGGEVYRYHFNGALRNVGIENIRLESSFVSDTDEEHGWKAVVFGKVENGWVRRVTAQYFGYAAVDIRDDSQFVTVEDCANLDPKSQITGGRRYSFDIDDSSFILMQRCYANEGRHDFVTGSKPAGPNVFVDCLAENTYSDIGPHQRYAEGLLFDNIRGGQMNVQNRRDSGSGHGWAGAQTVFWNNDATTMVVDAPAAAMNFSIGNIATQQQTWWPPNEPDGIWESQGVHVAPRSLYYAQLADRSGSPAVNAVTTAGQRSGTIWDELSAWAGDGSPPGLPVFAPVQVDAGRAVQIEAGPLTLMGSIRYALPEDFPLSQSWTQVSGPGGVAFSDVQSASPSVSFPAPGTYKFQFQATQRDDRDPGNIIVYSDSDIVAVTVTGPPVATLSASSVDSIVGRREDNAEALGYYVDAGSDLVGAFGSTLAQERADRDLVLGYTLPDVAGSDLLAGATLRFEITSKRNFSGIDPGLDVYLIDDTNPESTGTNYFFRGENDPRTDVIKVGETLISTEQGDSVSFPAGTHVQSFTLSGDALTRLQSFYAEDGTPNRSEVYFRFNLDDVESGSIQLDRYTIDVAPGASALDLYTVPGSRFANWIDDFGLPADQLAAGDDPDGDGIPNAVENFYGTDPEAFSTGITGLGWMPSEIARYFFEDFNAMPTFQEPTGVTFISSGGDSQVQVVPGDSTNPINDTNGLRVENNDATLAPVVEWDLASPLSAAKVSVDYEVTQTGSVDSGTGNAIFFSLGRQAGNQLSLNSSGNRLLNASFRDDGTIDYVAGGSESRLLNQSLALNVSGNLTVFVNDFDAWPIYFLNPQTDAVDTLAANSAVFFLNGAEAFRSGLVDNDLGGGLVSASSDNIGRVGFAGISSQRGVRLFVDDLLVEPISFFTFTHPQNPEPVSNLTANYRWSADLQQFYGDGESDADGTIVKFDPRTEADLTTVHVTVLGTPTDRLFVSVEATID